MRAQSADRSNGNEGRIDRTADIVPSANASSHCVSSICSKYPSPGPIVWTRLLSCPHRSETAAKPSAMDSASAISTLIPTASGAPASRSDTTAASSAPWLLAITATLAPSAARVSAMASPIPLLPPVTTAVDPAKPRSIRVSLWLVCGWLNLRDPFRRHAQPLQAKTEHAFADIVAVTIACRPLPLDARPHHGVDSLRVGHRIDVMEYSALQAALKSCAERLEQLLVRRPDQIGGGEHLRLSLLRHAAQIRFDVVVECQVESSVDPRRHRVDLRGGGRHSAS